MAYKSIGLANRKTIFTTLITTYGLKPNEHIVNNIDSVVLLKELFV